MMTINEIRALEALPSATEASLVGMRRILQEIALESALRNAGGQCA